MQRGHCFPALRHCQFPLPPPSTVRWSSGGRTSPHAAPCPSCFQRSIPDAAVLRLFLAGSPHCRVCLAGAGAVSASHPELGRAHGQVCRKRAVGTGQGTLPGTPSASSTRGSSGMFSGSRKSSAGGRTQVRALAELSYLPGPSLQPRARTRDPRACLGPAPSAEAGESVQSGWFGKTWACFSLGPPLQLSLAPWGRAANSQHRRCLCPNLVLAGAGPGPLTKPQCRGEPWGRAGSIPCVPSSPRWA